MAEAGKIYKSRIEIDEFGQIWLVQNNFESDSVIEEMEAVAHNEVLIEDEFELDEYGADDYYNF